MGQEIGKDDDDQEKDDRIIREQKSIRLLDNIIFFTEAQMVFSCMVDPMMACLKNALQNLSQVDI